MGTRFWRFSVLIIKNVLKLLLLISALQVLTAQASEQRLLILGDSISAAYGMSVSQGWVALLAGRLEQTHPEVIIINASISGETTGGGLRRLPELLAQHEPTIVLLELGGNDALRGFPIKSFRNNLTEMTTLSQAEAAKVVLVQMEIPPNYGTRYTSAFRDSYSLVAENTDSVLAPFLLDGVAGNTKLMQNDGIHPNEQAQSRLLDNILPTLLPMLD
jgi:acyl-CoA thioesterase-1